MSSTALCPRACLSHIVPFRAPVWFPSVAYLPHSCCCRAKVSDSAGGPDHSFFAPSDQLSHFNNCFDLSSFSFTPSLDSYDVVALLLLFHDLLFPLFQNLFTFSHRCVIVPSIVSALPYYFLFTYYLQGSPRFARLVPRPPSPRATNRTLPCSV